MLQTSHQLIQWLIITLISNVSTLNNACKSSASKQDLSNIPPQHTVTEEFKSRQKVIYLLPSLDLSENCLSLQTFLREDRHGVRTVSSYHHKQVPPALVVDYISSKTLRGFRDGDSYNTYCSNMASWVHLIFYRFVTWFNYSRLNLPAQPQTSRPFFL